MTLSIDEINASLKPDEMTQEELDEALLLAEQLNREKVIPKLECFRQPARYKLAFGGRGCIRGDTLIDTPTGKVQIKDFEGGEVLSFNGKTIVSAFAYPPKKYPSAGLFEVKTAEGYKFVSTLKHRVLTNHGWKHVYDLSANGNLLIYAPSRLQTSSDIFCSTLHEDELRYTHKAEDYRDRYSVCSRQCDGQPRLEANSDQSSFPLQGDVRERTRDHYGMDDSRNESIHILICRLSFLLSMMGFSPLGATIGAVRRGFCGVCKSFVLLLQSFLQLRQFPLNSFRKRSACESHQVARESFFSSQFLHIESITYMGEEVYYDIHVPLYNNYIACGMVHHNSGKSRGISSLLCQLAQREPKKILCTREVQLSLEESVYAVIVETLAALKYTGWTVTKEAISHVNGSRFIFRGLKDLRAANAVKSMEGIDICWIEEAQSVSAESLKVLIPTIRKDGSEIWASWNPTTVADPVMEYTNKPGAMVVEVNWNDNPWFPEVLKIEKDDDFRNNPDEAEHIWNGQPRKQGDNAVMSRVKVREAMDRIAIAEGAEEIGVDVARFGDDSTQMYRRHGMKTIAHKELRKADTMEVARTVWDFADRRHDILIKIDGGYNPGVIDAVRELGGNVQEVNFGGSAMDTDKYPDTASEMWFEFPIDEAQIPDDNSLMTELSGRLYNYDSKGRRRVEPKGDYKKRNSGKSPDKADALLVCYATSRQTAFDDDIIAVLKARRDRV